MTYLKMFGHLLSMVTVMILMGYAIQAPLVKDLIPWTGLRLVAICSFTALSFGLHFVALMEPARKEAAARGR